MKRITPILILILLGLIAQGLVSAESFLETQEAVSATYIVNSANDVDDGNCNGSHCSFREAINAANANSGHDTIMFDFNSAVVIKPNSNLPSIYEGVTIDGISLTGANCASATSDSELRVTLDGSLAGSFAIGLSIAGGGDGAIIKGLAIIGFAQDGINTYGSDLVIQCNHIGLDAQGNFGSGNGYSGIEVNAGNVTIGGDSIDDRNVISGNGLYGIKGLSSMTVAGNYIGTKPDGVTAIGNGGGIILEGANNIIGGFNVNERNIIAGNDWYGIFVGGDTSADNNLIINNYIGVNKNGDPLANLLDGIYLNASHNTTVGGNSSVSSNLIAYNGQNGIRVGPDSVENALLNNSIHDNGFLGIDLQVAGDASGQVTYNDFLDSDTGANELQNWPVLQMADETGRVAGSLIGAPGNDLSIFFYTNDDCDDSGNGEGETFKQAVDISIPAGGAATIDVILSGGLPTGKYVTATAIDSSDGNTSEFSNCALVTEVVYTVNSTADTADAIPGDGNCKAAGSSDVCTLRAAIEEVNAAPANGPFSINFNLSGPGPHQITPSTPLPAISKRVRIDGTSQTGATCPIVSDSADLRIILNGGGLTNGSGLTLTTGSVGSEIRGLVIGAFPAHGILVESDKNTIACNHIGIDVTGTADFGNLLNGIRVDGSNNRIGGSSIGQRNVISGNDLAGVLLNSGATANKVQRNFIGVNANGDGAVGNSEAGVRLNGADNNRIGGVNATTRNIISGNGMYGVHIRAESDGNKVQGNWIGVNSVGIMPIPNGYGVYIRNSDDNEIGGNEPEKGNLISGNSSDGLLIFENAENNLVQNNIIGLRINGNPLGNGMNGVMLHEGVTGTQVLSNTIAHSGGDGIRVLLTSTNNALRFNLIYNSGQLGIDLNGDGVTANDGPGDPDTGPNGLQNYPVLDTAYAANGQISGSLASSGLTSFRIDFYRNQSCHNSNHGEGQEYLGTRLVNTAVGGVANFTVTVGGFSSGNYITAVATHPLGNSSEFSACIQAADQAPTPTPTNTPTATPSNTPTPTATNTPPTATPPVTPTATNTPPPNMDNKVYIPLLLN